MTTNTLTLGILQLVAKQDGPYLRANVSGESGFLGQLHFTVAEWTSLAALVDVLSAADRRHAEDRAALIAAKEGIERGGDLLKQAQAAMREQAAALDAAVEQRDALRAENDVLKREARELEQQRDAARTELRDVLVVKQQLTEERDTAVASLAGYRVLFDEQGRALTKARQEVAAMRGESPKPVLGKCAAEGCDNDADPRWFAHGPQGEAVEICDGHEGTPCPAKARDNCTCPPLKQAKAKEAKASNG